MIAVLILTAHWPCMFAKTWTNAMMNHRALLLFWLHCVVLYFNHLQPQSTCGEFQWGGFLMGSNSLNTDCSCHAHGVISDQALLSCSITTGETLAWWLETSAPFAGDPGISGLPAVTQCLQFNALKSSYSVCQFSHEEGMFSWWCH